MLYVDDILLGSSVRVFYLRPKVFILIFQLKDIGVASYILGIDIHRDRKKEV